jgi:pSer/pThr/pTyr-binding forkhead associated (FHA) protein
MQDYQELPGRLVLMAPDKPIQEYILTSLTATIGRAEIADIVLDDTKVSRTHARLDCRDHEYILTDLKSANGTWVNGQRVTGEVTLQVGDSIRFGDNLMRFERTTPSLEQEGEMTILAVGGESEVEVELDPNALSMNVTNTRETRLVVYTTQGTTEAVMAKDILSMGRGEQNDVVLQTGQASRRHAQIERRGDEFVLHDLNSTNGTWFRGERVDERKLEDGDTFRIGNALMVFKKGFEPEDLTMMDVAGALPAPKGWADHRPVVIVPGLMGSELWLGGQKLWPNLGRMLSDAEILALPGDAPIEARGLVNEVVVIPNIIKLAQYNRLSEFLEETLGYERGRNLLEFPYDWRQDNRVSARRLGQAIEEWQSRIPEANRPITIIAHSLGCLVSRYYVDCLGGREKVGRVLFLGGPHYGVPKSIPVMLAGPGLLPFGLMDGRLRRVLTTFPSSYQILPTYPCVQDHQGKTVNVLLEDSWVSDGQRSLLRNAASFWRELGHRCSVPAVAVFGYGMKTVTSIRIREHSNGLWKKADLTLDNKGDTGVPERSAVLEGAEIHPVMQHHGSLYVDNDVKMRLKLELLKA